MLNIFSSALAGLTDLYQPQEDLEVQIAEMSLKVVMYSAIAVIILVLLAWAFNDKKPKLKMPLFIGIAGIMALSTLTLIFSTVYLNVKSESGGPVHWHADVEVWVCGNEMNLRDPTGFSNKIGTSVLHEHNDRRIHLEGVAVEKSIDASLGKFMYVIDGTISDNALVAPLNPDPNTYFEPEIDGDGPSNANAEQIEPYIIKGDEKGDFIRVVSGEKCGDDTAEVQVFVYNFDEKTGNYEQKKVSRPQDYVITDNPNVPPGDCIIFEFDKPKEKTDKLCGQYGVRDIDRCEDFGVKPEERAICKSKQQNYSSDEDYYTSSSDSSSTSSSTPAPTDELINQLLEQTQETGTENITNDSEIPEGEQN